jgi:hypothetical protein
MKDILLIEPNKVILASNISSSMTKISRIFFILLTILFFSSNIIQGQVNTVQFGRNRVQFKKFKWQYYRTKNFNTYFNQDGIELAKFTAQVAEEELPDIEKFTEYNMQQRTTIIVYNNYGDFMQSNIGMQSDWQSTGGLAKLVNNKLVVYFNGDHQNLRRQIREGIARVIMSNLLYGGDLGENASNQTLLDLPSWFSDGYIAFTAENWNPTLDDHLKSIILSGKYKSFYSLAYDEPLLAGHAFWYYIEEKYKKENVTYFLYLTRMAKSLNKAAQTICKKKFNPLLSDFMTYEAEKYDNDNNHRKTAPKGSAIESFDISKRLDYYRINVNPNKKNGTYAFVEYNKGIVSLKFYDGDTYFTLLQYGIRSYRNETDPDYPLITWDKKGESIAVVYLEEGQLKLFVYDIFKRIKTVKLDLTDDFGQVQDIKYMPDNRTLLLSAVKNGHTDIFTLDLQSLKIIQITDDVYDDLDASFVSFPNKTGILFASNRPDANAKSADSILPSKNRYNIFLITNFGSKPELNEITQLTNLKYGNARYPTQYNNDHFTFVSDENGIGNRYAGFFTTKSAGLDTLVLIGDDILRNPSQNEIDSSLLLHKKQKVDSIAVVAVSEDSAYSFPITNYANSIVETRIAGDNNQVSEVTEDENEKTVYKLKIDENVLRKRNITALPTTYMKRVVMADKISKELAPSSDNDSSLMGKVFNTDDADKKTVLQSAKLYTYSPPKFYTEFSDLGLNTSALFNTTQKYQGGSGPIILNAGSPLDGLIKLGTTELMEDQKISGGFSTDLQNDQWLVNYQNYKRRWDWGLTYYRSSTITSQDTTKQIFGYPNDSIITLGTRTITNIALANVAYPFDNARRIGLSFGIRKDRTIYTTDVNDSGFILPDAVQTFALTHLEYVYDNTLNPAQNIWQGLRYKFFMDWNTDISKEKNNSGKFNFDWGFDVRNYVPIYRNFIWATRAAGNFSWGNQKTIYYLGGEDGWVSPTFNSNNKPAQDQTYAFQGLAANLRGFEQNVANGNNALVLNSEFRLPLFTTFIDKPITKTFLRNFQLIQFIDLGNAWNGNYNSFQRPETIYGDTSGIQVKVKAGGIGPFAGGYGFGARSMLLGYYLKLDTAWPMVGFFRGKPMWYFSMGLDF